MALTRSGILLWAATVMFAAMPALEATAQSLPEIDLQARCRQSERTMVDMLGSQLAQGSAFDTCLRSEQDARGALQKAWTDIPASYKSYCIRPADYLPSYIEWIACLELMIDLKKLRAAYDTKLGSPSGRCPIISYTEDGSVRRVNACAL